MDGGIFSLYEFVDPSGFDASPNFVFNAYNR